MSYLSVEGMVQQSSGECDHCQSEQLFAFDAKCSDTFRGKYVQSRQGGKWVEYTPPCYVPHGVLGGSDFVLGILCLSCGKWQGKFPAAVERDEPA